jgi:hypothetical protein
MSISKPVRKPLRIAALNLLLLCVACLGIGMLWAYQIFHTSYSRACHDALLQQEMIVRKECNNSQRNNKGDSSSCSADLQASEQALFQLQGAVQRRALSECLHRYGKPPYVVEIHFRLVHDDDNNEHVLSIELDRVYDMPFTTDSFFQLIDYGLYTETSLGPSSPTNNIVGGSPSDAATRVRTRLLRSYAELGYGTSATPFILDEQQSCHAKGSDCRKYSFGFASQKPEFTILTTDDAAAGSLQCIGRVLPSGYPALKLLQTPSRKDAATIIEVRIQGMESVSDASGRQDDGRRRHDEM